jgi:exodeoxyribonuclease VII large subunit
VHTRARVTSLSPQATLERGYAVVQHGGGAVLRSAADVAPGEEVSIRLGSGGLDASVTGVRPG